MLREAAGGSVSSDFNSFAAGHLDDDGNVVILELPNPDGNGLEAGAGLNGEPPELIVFTPAVLIEFRGQDQDVNVAVGPRGPPSLAPEQDGFLGSNSMLEENIQIAADQNYNFWINHAITSEV
jgi:hypothetical protein